VLYPLSYEGRERRGYPAGPFVEEALMLSDTGGRLWFDAGMRRSHVVTWE
jgi:hypothetical protein